MFYNSEPLFISPTSNLSIEWSGSALREESTLHQLSPYLGKMKSSMACTLISEFTKEGNFIYDPFSGSGTVAFEAWVNNRNIIANDLSPYAYVLTLAKLFPLSSIHEADAAIDKTAKKVSLIMSKIDLRQIPKWVRSFFHPETLREIVSWSYVLRENRSFFLLACLLGILHHQRPGFLSYPCSHTVPYLREKKFPRDIYPELYDFRSVRDRLEKKVYRALKRVPVLNHNLIRTCHKRNSASFLPKQRVDAIITSPPYMRQLDYGRDNRLRLWFLGHQDWKMLDCKVSPPEVNFFHILRKCLKLWHNVLTPRGVCVFVLGDTYSKLYNLSLPEAVVHIATEEIGGYSMIWTHTEAIPNERRVRRGYYGSLTETVLVLQKSGVI